VQIRHPPRQSEHDQCRRRPSTDSMCVVHAPIIAEAAMIALAAHARPSGRGDVLMSTSWKTSAAPRPMGWLQRPSEKPEFDAIGCPDSSVYCYTFSVHPMRGDSVRDLYASLLALVGLGVLACMGALVDYWPVGIELPISAPGRVIASVGPLPVPQAAVPVPIPAQYPVTTPARQPRRLNEPVLAVQTVQPPLIAARVALWSPRPIGAFPIVAARELPGIEITLSDPVAFEAERLDYLALAAPIPESGSALADGFISGAVKRTGSSLVKTGLSVVDAVRVVGGAVRKALPN
jgi:hypothetical protein